MGIETKGVTQLGAKKRPAGVIKENRDLKKRKGGVGERGGGKKILGPGNAV